MHRDQRSVKNCKIRVSLDMLVADSFDFKRLPTRGKGVNGKVKKSVSAAPNGLRLVDSYLSLTALS